MTSARWSRRAARDLPFAADVRPRFGVTARMTEVVHLTSEPIAAE
jgi:hypothetical protein